jgi:hypothetical protein
MESPIFHGDSNRYISPVTAFDNNNKVVINKKIEPSNNSQSGSTSPLDGRRKSTRKFFLPL